MEESHPLGGRLRRLRREKGLTQQEVAAPKYTPAYISTIETGRRVPSKAALAHFADRLGVTLDELESGVPSSFDAEKTMLLQAGWQALYLGDYEDAQRSFASVEREARNLDRPELRARALVGLALCAERQGQTEDALGLYEQALDLFGSHAPRPAAVEAVAGVARCHQMAGDARLASHVLESFLLDLEGEHLGDPAAVMRAYASLVWPYMELGLYDKANDAALKALKLQARVDAPEDVAGMHLNVARALLNMDRPDDALASLNKAEEIYKNLNWRTEIGRAHTNRAIVYMGKGDIAAARNELQTALGIFKEVGAVRSEALALNELARMERLSDNDSVAAEHAHKAVELLSEMQAVPELALAHRELALSLSGEAPEDAEKHFRIAIELYEQCAEGLHAADAHRLLGDLLVKQKSAAPWGEYRKGLVLVAEALDRKDEVGDVEAEIERINEGAAWKQRIVDFLMESEADGKMKDFVDDQVRMRMEELCRTENRYIEVSDSLAEAGLTIRDGRVYYTKNGDERPIDELFRAADLEAREPR